MVRYSRIAALILLAAVASAAAAQNNKQSIFTELSHWQGVITGRPYTGLLTVTLSQTARDGTTFRQVTLFKQARDSEGRTYSELFAPSTCTYACGNLITIYDPAQHTTTHWDTYNKVVTVNDEAAQVVGGPRSGVIITRTQGVRDEDLGWQTIQGLSAHGARRTSTYSAGAFGSNRSVTSTQEIWYSPDLGLQVLSINKAYDGTISTSTLTNIDRGEPAPALFQIPKQEDGAN